VRAITVVTLQTHELISASFYFASVSCQLHHRILPAPSGIWVCQCLLCLRNTWYRSVPCTFSAKALPLFSWCQVRPIPSIVPRFSALFPSRKSCRHSDISWACAGYRFCLREFWVVYRIFPCLYYSLVFSYLPFLAASLNGIFWSFVKARQHFAISFTTSVTFAFGDLFKIS